MIPIYTPTTISKRFWAIPCQHLVMLDFLVFANCLEVKWYIIMVLICSSLIVNEIEYSFFVHMCFLFLWNVCSCLLSVFYQVLLSYWGAVLDVFLTLIICCLYVLYIFPLSCLLSFLNCTFGWTEGSLVFYTQFIHVYLVLFGVAVNGVFFFILVLKLKLRYFQYMPDKHLIKFNIHYS